MTEYTDLVLEHLRAIRAELGTLREDVREIKLRLGHVETELAHVHSVLAAPSVRMDRMGTRI